MEVFLNSKQENQKVKRWWLKMTLPYKPTRTFDAKVGDPSTGNAGPDGLKADIDKLRKMFDPDAIHDNGDSGGIHKGNLANESGIVTEDNVNSYINNQRFSLSGRVGGSSAVILPHEEYYLLQKIGLYVPTGKKLYLKRVRFWFLDERFSLNVYAAYYSTEYSGWTSSSHRGDIELNVLLKDSNVIGNELTIAVKKDGPSEHVLIPYDSWWVELAIE